MVTPDDVLSFWLDDVGPAGWYETSPELDQKIRTVSKKPGTRHAKAAMVFG